MASQLKQPPPVLIVGAGPTGMLLSLWLNKFHVPHRIIDKNTSPGQTSRAIVVHARTLEFYRILGAIGSSDGLSLDDEIRNLGAKIEALQINSRGERRGRVEVGDAGVGVSKFPYILSVTQDEHEEVLQRRLEGVGQRVERGVEMIGMTTPTDEKGDAKVRIRPVDGSRPEEEVKASYVIGCDGAHSAVRHATGIAMEGGTYERTFFVADVFCHGPMQTDGNLNMCLSRNEFVIILPMPHKENRARIIGIVPQQLQHPETEEIKFEDCLPSMNATAPGLKIEGVRWFAHYRVHHQTAASFQYQGRVFLCGDAAHLHSPVGGQGMNTGLGDATNLAWKVATAWHASADGKPPEPAEILLETYEKERKRFADHLVASNDRLFQFIIQQNSVGWLLRNVWVPYVMPFLANVLNLRFFLYKMVSQTGIEYAPSTLSESSGAKGLAGYRLPWMERPDGAAGKEDNHSLLDGSGWQAHIFGSIGLEVKSVLRDADVPLHLFPWGEEAEERGFKKDAVYLVRPDGYLGLALKNQAGSQTVLKKYIQDFGVGRLG